MEPFDAAQIIAKKRDAQKLDEREIEWFIKALLEGEVKDYHASALLMAIFINGMGHDETLALTKAMLNSGKKLHLDDLAVVDKHSTGGIGDKASFVVGPLAAACGIKVPMVAGRGLGHTGGTIDKIESVPGFNSDISLDDFTKLLKQNHIVLVGQTKEIAPADGILYALRDVTATIGSIPLITASILSKKLAEGAKGLVMDIKFGPGAFMKTRAEASHLGRSIIEVAKGYGVKTMAFVTDMGRPLGHMVGHSVEIIEAIETLKGNGPSDLEELSIALAGGMIYLGGKSSCLEEGVNLARGALKDGSALGKFQKLLEAQGASGEIVDDYSQLPLAREKYEIKARERGYIESFQNAKIGTMLQQLGGGRKSKEDAIDLAVGLCFKKRPPDFVEKGMPVAIIYHHPGQRKLAKELEQYFFSEIMAMSPRPPAKVPLIAEVLQWPLRP